MRRLLIVAAFVTLGCDALQWGYPRTGVSVTSPDGKYVALVRNHPSIDPPEQSIWIRDCGGQATKIRQLGSDTHWCNRIEWSPDSRTATFFVQSTVGIDRVRVDARTRQIIR